MLKRAMSRIFFRIARAFGIPEIQHRLDLIQTDLERFPHTTDLRFGAIERHLEKRLNNYLIDQAAHTQQQLTDQATHIQQQLTDQATHHDRLVSDLHQLLNEAQSALSNSTKQHTEVVTNEIRVHLEGEIRTTKRDLDNIRRMVASTPAQIGIAKTTAPIIPNSVIDDSLYISLEDHFRGAKEEVRKRQIEYVPYVKEIVSEKFPLLDLGFGWGEWLKVLSDSNISAKGIDSNVA